MSWTLQQISTPKPPRLLAQMIVPPARANRPLQTISSYRWPSATALIAGRSQKVADVSVGGSVTPHAAWRDHGWQVGAALEADFFKIKSAFVLTCRGRDFVSLDGIKTHTF